MSSCIIVAELLGSCGLQELELSELIELREESGIDFSDRIASRTLVPLGGFSREWRGLGTMRETAGKDRGRVRDCW